MGHSVTGFQNLKFVAAKKMIYLFNEFSDLRYQFNNVLPSTIKTVC